MSTTEHLELILEFCRRNLAIAEKRTKGPWGLDHDDDSCFITVGTVNDLGFISNPVTTMHSESDAEFIATCAGAAESGWRATIVAIECINGQQKHIDSISQFLKINGQYFSDLNPHRRSMDERNQQMLNSILTIYPIDLIQT